MDESKVSSVVVAVETGDAISHLRLYSGNGWTLNNIVSHAIEADWLIAFTDEKLTQETAVRTSSIVQIIDETNGKFEF